VGFYFDIAISEMTENRLFFFIKMYKYNDIVINIEQSLDYTGIHVQIINHYDTTNMALVSIAL